MQEQVFFPDPSVDRLLGVVLSLAAEVYLLRDRLHVIETVCEQHGLPAPGALAQQPFQPDPARREAFINSILEPLLTGARTTSTVDGRYVHSIL